MEFNLKRKTNFQKTNISLLEVIKILRSKCPYTAPNRTQVVDILTKSVAMVFITMDN